MATISSDTYLDDSARTAGEAWTINSGAKFTIRTDTRWHANAPASMTGSLGSQTISEGEIVYDGTDVRWLAFDSGTGTVPAIGTNITQAEVTSSYLLGVYADLSSAPIAVGSSMPASGFLKFREVTGVFTAGSLTGINANATSADVTGWIEIVCDSAANITVPRLGKHTIRGDWFYLSNTDGTIGQTIQIPTNGGGSGTHCPGVWIETGSSTNTYEFWPALNGASNGWSYKHLGAAYGETDARQNFVKNLGSGQIQIGEASDIAGTYSNIAAQASTYASIVHSCTYTWASNLVTVYYSTGHLLRTGQQVHLDFTSGSATSYDDTYTVTVIDAYYYTVPLTGSGTSGSVTARPGHTITFTAHTLGTGDVIYCEFTSGSGVNGNYTIYGITSANAYLIEAPHSATTSGNVSTYSRLQITSTSHGLAIGNRVYLDFTSGGATSGIYTIVAVATNTFDINYPHSSAVSGDVAIKQTIGNIPPSGCRVRIPNVILRECATASRASNLAPNSTIASRPEWTTTSAGAIDFEYVYGNWYFNLNQAYSVRLYHFCTFDTLIITECATALDVNDGGVGMFGSLDIVTIVLTSNFAGGTVANVKGMRGNTPGTSDHAIALNYCIGTTLDHLQGGIIQFARGSGKAIQLNYCTGITANDCRVFNSDFNVTACFNITINDTDTVDRFIGYTNATTSYYAVNINTKCNNVLVDGVTFGLNGTISNVHPCGGVFSAAASDNVTFRNAGTFSSRLNLGSWRMNAYNGGYVYGSGGNNTSIKVQRCYVNDVRTGLISTVNSDKNIVYESLYCGKYVESAKATIGLVDAGLNSIIKGCSTGTNSTSGQASVYGTHFWDMFLGDNYGRLILAMNEPTTETDGQFTLVSGTEKWNSSGGILMGVIGNQAIWEDSVYRKGHTGFTNSSPAMSGGTIGNYTVEYQIDTGSGYGGTWKTANGTNLSGETISPTTGFKLKVRITTTTTNTAAITYLRFNTTTSASAQSANLYSLNLATVTLTNMIGSSRYEIYNLTTTTTLTTSTSPATSQTTPFSVIVEASNGDNLRIRVRESSATTEYLPFETETEVANNAANVFISQVEDTIIA